MAHWPTIAATTALAAFAVAGALIHVGAGPAFVGVSAGPGSGAAGAGTVRWDAVTVTPLESSAAGSAQLRDMAAVDSAARAGRPDASGSASIHAPPAAALQHAGGGETGGDAGVDVVVPHGAAAAGLRPPVPVSVAPLPPLPAMPAMPPLPPQAPPVPGMTGQDPMRAVAAPVAPAVPHRAAAAAPPVRMAVAMPLSIPQLGPLDPARIGDAARELAETVHVLASRAGGRTLAAEQAAAEARKQLDDCVRVEGHRPAAFLSDTCYKAGL